MRAQLETLKSESAALMAQADSLQKQREALLPQTQQPIPDVNEIQSRLISALGSGDETLRRTINTELQDAKKTATEVKAAQSELDNIVDQLRDIHAQTADLANQMKPLQAGILAEEAQRLGAAYKTAAAELVSLFLSARALAFEAERMGGPALVPASFRSAVAVELPCPIVGLSQFGRLSFTAGLANDQATLAAAQAAQQRAAALI